MKNKICKILDGEYFWVFFAILGALIQTTVFLFTQDSYLSFVSGIAGVFSVVLCSEKSVSGFYFWSFLQIITFAIICFQEQLWGKLVENAFYFITMLVGLIIWSRNKREEKVVPREMKIHNLLILCLVNAFGIILVSCLAHIKRRKP